ncbi:hypothetical protein [Sphingomonas sp.]|uniref:hypothetical protein n=1 Tax=Sphingomonas sp. TaxID=28214 RepID=UPI001B08D819|nr:hypothetical protein [Sphingomonas sp.]MBO9713542.1 hypothetical protein [Sphingomonas sp.]
MELWLQHAAGFILLEDVRGYARGRIDPALDPVARAAAEKAIDDAVFGLMEVIDGFPAPLQNDRYRAALRMAVDLVDREADRTRVQINLAGGDGMAMGYHGWLAGDFGETPIVAGGQP